MRQHYLFFYVVLAGYGCKPRNFHSQVKSNEPVAQVPDPCPERFRGKLPASALKAYGNASAMRLSQTPWVDWSALLGADGTSAPRKLLEQMKDRANDYDGLFSGIVKGVANHLASGDEKARAEIGLLISILSLNQQRVDLLRCNMWDTNGTIDTYAPGKTSNHDQKWATLQDATANCTGDRLRFRTLDGVCNSVENPLMGAAGQRFARSVSFAATQERKGILLDTPDPSVISQKLLTRRGPPSKYRRAPFLNGLAAAWIQFMTHDWFSHALRGKNDESRRLSAKMNIPATIVDGEGATRNPPVSRDNANHPGSGTYRNNVSFWWDASQIYGSDEPLAGAVRDPKNRALMLTDENGFLPRFKTLGNVAKNIGLHAHEFDQEISGFPDNWWIGLSLLNTVFVREHNRFVKELALKHFGKPVTQLTPRQEEEAFQYGRLYISALIAKIHTLEWTPQLLFNPVLDASMNANWHGLAAHRFGSDNQAVNRFRSLAQNALKYIKDENRTDLPFENNALFAFGVSLPGVTGGVSNHFGSPFTLPEEFTTVYRLHPLLPDQIEYREAKGVIEGTAKLEAFTPFDTQQTLRGKSADNLTKDSFLNWIVSMGVQPTGTLSLHNYPRFLQKLEIPQNPSWAKSGQIDRTVDLAAVDIMRDRERGIPRFNEFRRQIGLVPLRDMTDFINVELAFQVFTACGEKGFERSMLSKERVNALKCPNGSIEAQEELAYQVEQRDLLVEVYGSDKDAIERVDVVVGTLSENTRPHGFAISETQFQIFIANAARRLFSDRFFSSDFNAKTYTEFGFQSLKTRGMRDVIADNVPELEAIMGKLCNAFDPWTRPRNGFSLASGFDTVNFQGANCTH